MPSWPPASNRGLRLPRAWAAIRPRTLLRRTRLAVLRRRVLTNKYHVPAEDVADAMIAFFSRRES